MICLKSSQTGNHTKRQDFSLIRVSLFLTILLAPLYVVRFSVGSYPSTLLEVLVGLTVASWLVEKGVRGLKGTKDLRLDLPIALFLFAAVVSVIISPDKRGALGIFKAYFIEPILLFFVVEDVVRSEKDWWRLFIALGLSGFWVALLAVFQGLTDQLVFAPHEAALGRAHAVYNTANGVGLYLGPIALLALGAILGIKGLGSMSGVKDAAVVGGVGVMVAAIVLSKSSGAMVGLLGGLAVLGVLEFLGAKRGLRVLGIMGLLVVVVGAWFFFNISNFTPQVADPYVRESSDTLSFRLCLWEGARNMLLDHPILGAGLSGFKELYFQKYFTCDAEPLEYPHNWILNFWVETGLLGLLSFLLILHRYFVGIKQVGYSVKVNRGFEPAFVAAMVYWLVHGLVDVPYFKNDLSLEFWVVLGLADTLRFVF